VTGGILMQPLVVDAADISSWVSRLWWPVIRIGGFVASAPVISAATVPVRVKAVLTVAVAFLLAPAAHAPADLSIFSAAGFLTAAQELLIGVSIGMVVQLAFEALTLAGQTVATTMGLGFATLVDPQRGANTAVLGQLFMVFAVLTYLATDGQLALIAALAHSFQSLPIGAARVDEAWLLAVVTWGGRIFETGLMIALPAVIALLIVNLALGVVTRAAPQLNLFGVGFPITLLAGFVVLYAGMDGLMAGIASVIHSALAAVVQMTSVAAARVP